MSFVFVVLLFSPGYAAAWDTGCLRDWLARDAAPGYRQYRDELITVFETDGLLDAARELLFQRLKEGAVKSIPPARVIMVLDHEAGLLVWIPKILAEYGFTLEAGEPETSTYLKTCLLVLRDGISDELFAKLTESAHGVKASLSRLIQTVEVVFQLRQISSLDEAILLPLGQTLIDSDLPESSMGSLVSLFIKGKGRRLSETEVIAVMIDIFEDDGSIIQLEREFARRGR